MKTIISFITICLALFIALPVHSKENLQKWGKVNSASLSSVAITSENEKDINNPNFSFSVSSKTILEGIKSPTDLKKGEFVIIEYTIDTKQRLDAEKITAPQILYNIKKQEQKTQTNQGDDIKKIWEEINRIKQRLNM